MDFLRDLRDSIAGFSRDVGSILWPAPNKDGMHRFKDMRPKTRSSFYSGFEAIPTFQFFALSNSRYFEWLTFPRRKARLCTKLLLILVTIGFAVVYLSPVLYFPLSRTRNDVGDAQLTCDIVSDAYSPAQSQGLVNTFASYKYFGEKCNISSLELHRPYEPICPNRTTMLTAMSSGGRIGRDAPYFPRDCGMRWYTTEEVCDILGRFSQVILVGDSMLRHVIGALNIIVRENLGYGGVTDWNFDTREMERCFCNDQFDVTDCSVQGIYKTEDVIKHDPLSLACPRLLPGWSTDLRMEQMVRYPIEKVELERLEAAMDARPGSRKAFILGHGLWNNLEIDKSKAWLDTVVKVIDSRLRLRMRLRTMRQGRNMPILLITPNAAGEKKPDEFIVTQGNKALVRFECTMALEAARQSIDHLGTWNMSIQANLYDGVHMDMRGNLLKAMMVLNWLNLLEE